MNHTHVISDEALHDILAAQGNHEYWLAYNTRSYFLGKDEIRSFRDKEKAEEFSLSNKSDHDTYHVIYANSIAAVFRKIPYAGLHEANLSSIKTTIMDEKTVAFNEAQFKSLGMLEAFTPDLKEQMKQGAPLIQHHFQKDYEGDKVEATLYLKKSSTSDHYFLNKYDLELQKAGQQDSIKQTFYKSAVKNESDENNNQKKQENKYTLKEGYNLLAGRPVFKTFVSSQGQEYQAWAKLNANTVLGNGNHEIKQYNNNYGFNLESVLQHYSIKELANEQYKQSLVDSLHRGNLQKATFVDKEGKEEKRYISPSITTGSLYVYDLNKQRVSLDSMVQKQLINLDFANQLKERFTQKQVPGESQKQESTPSQSTEAKQSQVQQPTQKKEQKQAREKKEKKSVPKNKVH